MAGSKAQEQAPSSRLILMTTRKPFKFRHTSRSRIHHQRRERCGLHRRDNISVRPGSVERNQRRRQMYKEAALAICGCCMAYLGENPAVIAKLGLPLAAGGPKYNKGTIDTVCKNGFKYARKFNSLLHSQRSTSHLEDVAGLVWFDHHRYIKQVEVCNNWLQEHCDTEVAWDSDAESLFVEMFDKTLGPKVYDISSVEPDNLGYGGRDWVALGFQGKDPTRDLRSTGRLGFETFYRFCVEHEESTALVIESGSVSGSSSSNEFTSPWYPVALVSIRLTGALCDVFRRYPVYLVLIFGTKNTLKELKSRFAAIHAELMIELHQEWKNAVQAGQVTNYFDNESVFRKFEKDLPTKLWDMGKL